MCQGTSAALGMRRSLEPHKKFYKSLKAWSEEQRCIDTSFHMCWSCSAIIFHIHRRNIFLKFILRSGLNYHGKNPRYKSECNCCDRLVYHSPTWSWNLVWGKQAHDWWVSLHTLQISLWSNKSTLLSEYMEMAGWVLLDGMIHVFQDVLFKVLASVHTFQILPKLLKKITPTLIPSMSNLNCLASISILLVFHGARRFSYILQHADSKFKGKCYSQWE